MSHGHGGDILPSQDLSVIVLRKFGLYFHRQYRRTDDPECGNPVTTTTRPSSTGLRVYATVMLILMWINFVRSAWAFESSDLLGNLLFTKINVVTWLGLSAIFQIAYYFASHTGQLLEVLLTLPVTHDCVKKVRLITIGITASVWVTLVINATISVCLFFVTNGQYDFCLAPFYTYINVPEDKIILARCIGFLLYFWPIPCTILSPAFTVVLVYMFYHQFQKLEENFQHAIGKGQFNGEFSIFRRRHQVLSSAVNKVDGFMKFVNVAGFLCHIANIIVALYGLVFYPESTETPALAVINVAVICANVYGLMCTASTGIIVNHMVRKCSLY